MEINSKRQYKIAMIENETATIIEKTTIENIMEVRIGQNTNTQW